MRIASLGHAVFAASLVALGIAVLVQGSSAPAWLGIPMYLPARELLAYLCAVITLACGIGLWWRRAALVAARVLLVYCVLSLLLFSLPRALPAPAQLGAWYPCAETAVMLAAAWVLYVWFAADWDRQRLGFVAGAKGMRMARVLYGLALMFFGSSHFVYVNLTTPLVPGWLPAHLFWAYFFGCTYIAAGAALIIGVFARLAAALVTLQMGMFALLVWVPMLAAGHLHSVTGSSWRELVVTWTLMACGWVLADSYHDIPWLALKQR
ncbi:MAG: hypothetical protein KGL13_06020 [Gammaproteobacteria bacterium]|nr:hypothetical protein [Gammaproteobacteria bacterium]MDE2346005.1 hypothetical protein [Gammaproteobacteria bacterium]